MIAIVKFSCLIQSIPFVLMIIFLCRYLEPHSGHAEGMAWPLSANILDPVRTSIVCISPGHMVEVAGWFYNPNIQSNPDSTLQVLRVKNKFSQFQENVCLFILAQFGSVVEFFVLLLTGCYRKLERY